MNCTNKEQETAECEKRGCKGCFYNEKTADDLFKELGYEKVSDITENTGYVYFKKEKHAIYYEYPKIIFHNKIKKLTIQNDYLSIQELQAINKKVQELGWIHEREEKENE